MSNIIPESEVTKTLIIVILDESGSMEIQKNDVIGGFNSFVESQLELTEDKGRLVLVKFNTKVTVAHAVQPLGEVPRLDGKTYMPSGGTALYDAIDEAVRMAEVIVEKSERVLVLIMTDGEENSSKKANSTEIMELIKKHEALGNWTFAYIGENPEGWAKKLKVAQTNAMPYNMAAQRSNFTSAASAVRRFRGNREMNQVEQFFQPEDMK